MENIHTDEWDNESTREGFRWKRRRIVKRLGGRLLGGSLYLLEPGQKSFPYHAHHANEELLLVVEGHVVVRTPDGERALEAGDMVHFARGRSGAHQIINRSDSAARFIMFSTMIEPEVAEYPDSGNIGVFTGRPPGGEGEPELWAFLDGEATRDYYHGED